MNNIIGLLCTKLKNNIKSPIKNKSPNNSLNTHIHKSGTIISFLYPLSTTAANKVHKIVSINIKPKIVSKQQTNA